MVAYRRSVSSIERSSYKDTHTHTHIQGIRIKDNKPISRADFESWLECDLNSCKTVLRLVETMGCVVAGKKKKQTLSY